MATSHRDEWLSYLRTVLLPYLIVSPAMIFLWYGVPIISWLAEYFGSELTQFGPAQQRWHQTWVIGMLGTYTVGMLYGGWILWYKQKHNITPRFYGQKDYKHEPHGIDLANGKKIDLTREKKK